MISLAITIKLIYYSLLYFKVMLFPILSLLILCIMYLYWPPTRTLFFKCVLSNSGSHAVIRLNNPVNSYQLVVWAQFEGWCINPAHSYLIQQCIFIWKLRKNELKPWSAFILLTDCWSCELHEVSVLGRLPACIGVIDS